METIVSYLLKFFAAKATGVLGDKLLKAFIEVIVRRTKWTWDDEVLAVYKGHEQVKNLKPECQPPESQDAESCKK